MVKDSIEELRKEIEKIDDEILSLAAKRMELAESVGKIKNKSKTHQKLCC